MALVATLAEFKTWLRWTGVGTSEDTKLTDVLTSASEWVEWRTDGPLAVATFTESVQTNGWTLLPRRRPLATVTTITPEQGGTALSSTLYKVDTTNGIVRFYYGTIPGWYTLVYTAGWTTVPYRVKNAGLELARHLWLTQNGSSGRGRSDDDIPVPMGFAVPRRVDELLMSVNVGGFA